MSTATALNLDTVKSVWNGTFRANPGYQLLPFESLSLEEQELFSAFKTDPDFYGALRPREDTGLTAKSACRQTALLFNSLASAGPLPSFMHRHRGEYANRQIVELVLDGVLQILHDGELVYGSRAFSAVCESRPDAHAPVTEIARLSRQALRYAQALPFRDAATLSGRLYTWGRIPATPSWVRQFPNEQAIRECLLVNQGAKNALRLDARWKALPAGPDNDAWLFWQSRPQPTGVAMAACKLYVSPRPGHLREAFEAMVPALEHTRANAFKVGKDRSGLLRPDKMIAYFSHFEQAQEAADRILSQLNGCPAHGVPFTAQLGSPLLSWGVDPPTERNVPPWLARQSWRFWVTNRLAVALAQALRQADSCPAESPEPWQFAVDRLSLDGVDTDTWTPIRKETN